MKRCVLISVAVTSLLIPLAGVRGQIPTGQHLHETAFGNIERFLLHVPAGYDEEPTRKWPLLLYLHGKGGIAKPEQSDQQNADLLRSKTVPRILDRTPERFGDFIVVSPQSTSWWEPKALLRLLGEIEDLLRVDPDRILVTGQSMGGFGTYALLLEAPKKFAGGLPICGGDISGKVNKIDHIPLWIHHGVKDRTVPYANSRKTFDALVKRIREPVTTDNGRINRIGFSTEICGHVRFTTYPQVKHNSWDPAYAQDDVIRWLTEQVRP